MNEQAQQAYVDMVRTQYPDVYRQAMAMVKKDLSGLGFDFTSMFSTFTNAVSQVAPQILQLKQQRDMLKIQTERAKKGLPPVENTAGYNVALPYETTQSGAYNVEARFMGMPVKYLLIGGSILLIALFALRRK